MSEMCRLHGLTAVIEPFHRTHRRIRVLLRVATLAAALGGTAQAAQAAETLYSGPAADPAFAIIVPRLLTALYPNQRLNATAVADDATALDRVMADPTSAALVDLATMTAFATAKKLPIDRLEFHGPLEQRCLLAFARRDGWVQTFSDIISAKGSPRPTVGLAGTGAASLLTILRGIEPGLAGVDAQPGEAAPLAQQVEGGAPDLLLLVAYATLDHDLIEHLADENRLTVLPVVSRLIARAAVDRDSGFTMEPVSTDNDLLPWGRPKLITLCTPVGVVLRGDAPPVLRDAVDRAIPIVAGTLRPSLTDRASAAATNTVHDTLDAVQGLITRLRAN